MSFQKTPGGTPGARTPTSNPVTRALMRVMTSWHRRSGDKFQGIDLLYLTTVGAKTGQRRQPTVTRFPDGEDAWQRIIELQPRYAGYQRKTDRAIPLSGSPARTKTAVPAG